MFGRNRIGKVLTLPHLHIWLDGEVLRWEAEWLSLSAWSRFKKLMRTKQLPINFSVEPGLWGLGQECGGLLTAVHLLLDKDFLRTSRWLRGRSLCTYLAMNSHLFAIRTMQLSLSGERERRTDNNNMGGTVPTCIHQVLP